MAAEALIVEDAYQRGYADAIADMRKKKEQRRQREQAKKARRWYFIKQKAYGLAMLAAWATEGDITIAVITVPLGLMCLFSKKNADSRQLLFCYRREGNTWTKKQYSVLKSCKRWQSGA